MILSQSHKNAGVSGHFLLQGIFPHPGIEPVSCTAGGFLTQWAVGTGDRSRDALSLAWGGGALEVGEAGAGDHHEAREGPYSREDRSHNKNDSIDPVLTVYQRLSI